MGALNRIIAGLFSLLVAAGALLTIALATGGVPPERLVLIERAQATLAKLPLLGTGTIAAVLLVAVAVLLFALLLLLAQFRRHGSHGYLVREDDSGTFTVEPQAVLDIATFVGKEIQGVDSVACSSSQEKDGPINVRCKVFFRHGVPLEKAGEQFREAFRRQLEELTALKVQRLDLMAVYRAPRSSRDKRRNLA